ncbi:MAG: ABC transporter permease [Vicinamibacteria bacterium]
MNQLTYALRQLAKSPLLTSAAVLSLALAIGANTALFSIFDQLVLRPHSFSDPKSLVRVWVQSSSTQVPGPALSLTKYEFARDNQTVFTSVAASAQTSLVYTRVNAEPEQLDVQRVTASFFPTLAISPAIGRNFDPSEDKAGGSDVTVLSHEFARAHFGTASAALGQMVTLNGIDHRVIGVMPPHPSAPYSGTQAFITHTWDPATLNAAQVQAGARYLQVTARLRPGVTLKEANQELAILDSRYESAFVGRLDAKTPMILKTLSEELAGALGTTLGFLLGAVGAVLLIACANVSNLFLASLSARSKEVTIRLSMGAERRHITQQFMVESLIFSALATGVGAAGGRAALFLIQRAAINQLPPDTTLNFSPLTYIFMASVCMICTIAVGLFPAMQSPSFGIATVLRDASRGVPGGARGTRFRSGLIVAQVAVSAVLLVGSALLMLSFYRLQHTPAGLKTDGVATALLNVPVDRYKTPPERADFYRRVVERLKSNPQIKDASVAFGLPFAGPPVSPYTIFGQPVRPAPERALANLHIVGPDFFNVLGIPLMEGRLMSERDDFNAPGVCLINESFARRLFPSESAVGKRLLRGIGADIPVEIIGVVGNVRANGLTLPAPDAIYYAFAQVPKPTANLLARVDGDPHLLEKVMHDAVSQVDAAQPVASFQTMDAVLQQTVGLQRLLASVVALFATVALFLTSVGLYGVIAYSVAQRTSEIGVRIAIGARPKQIILHVLSDGMKLVSVGLIVGLGLAAMAGRTMSSLLFSVSAVNGPLYFVVALLFAMVAALACLTPAMRAARIDPLLALRGD